MNYFSCKLQIKLFSLLVCAWFHYFLNEELQCLITKTSLGSHKIE